MNEDLKEALASLSKHLMAIQAKKDKEVKNQNYDIAAIHRDYEKVMIADIEALNIKYHNYLDIVEAEIQH